MKTTRYIVGIEHKDGTQKYLRGTADVVDNPALGKYFELDASKADIISWVSKIRTNSISSSYSSSFTSYNMDTLKILTFTVEIDPIDADDIEWKTLLQRSALKKLLKIEIEALGLEKYELERRLAISDDDE